MSDYAKNQWLKKCHELAAGVGERGQFDSAAACCDAVVEAACRSGQGWTNSDLEQAAAMALEYAGWFVEPVMPWKRFRPKVYYSRGADSGPVRFWGFEGGVFSSQEIRRRGIHPLRCQELGRLNPETYAAGRWIYSSEDRGYRRMKPDAKCFGPTVEKKTIAGVLAANVRRVGDDPSLAARLHLSKKEIEALRDEHTLTIRDALGEFSCGYGKTDKDDS